jgi:hypothetical protein
MAGDRNVGSLKRGGVGGASVMSFDDGRKV